MEEKKTFRTTIHLELKHKKIIDKYIESLSEYVRDKIEKDFLSRRFLERKKKFYLAKVEEIEQDLAELELEEKLQKRICDSPEKINFWEKTLEVFEDPEGKACYFDGRLKLYNNLFGENLSKKEFEDLYAEKKRL